MADEIQVVEKSLLLCRPFNGLASHQVLTKTLTSPCLDTRIHIWTPSFSKEIGYAFIYSILKVRRMWRAKCFEYLRWIFFGD